MTPNQFIEKYRPFAALVEHEYLVPAVAILAQAALESGWGKSAIGNNIFGIKYRKGDWGVQQVLTTEYFTNRKDFAKLKPISVEFKQGLNKFKIVLRSEFADYRTPFEAFQEHAKLLLTDRYYHCLRWRNDPKRYLIAVWRSGYATDPNYGRKMCAMVDSINKRLK